MFKIQKKNSYWYSPFIWDAKQTLGEANKLKPNFDCRLLYYSFHQELEVTSFPVWEGTHWWHFSAPWPHRFISLPLKDASPWDSGGCRGWFWAQTLSPQDRWMHFVTIPRHHSQGAPRPGRNRPALWTPDWCGGNSAITSGARLDHYKSNPPHELSGS